MGWNYDDRGGRFILPLDVRRADERFPILVKATGLLVDVGVTRINVNNDRRCWGRETGIVHEVGFLCRYVGMYEYNELIENALGRRKGAPVLFRWIGESVRRAWRAGGITRL